MQRAPQALDAKSVNTIAAGLGVIISILASSGVAFYSIGLLQGASGPAAAFAVGVAGGLMAYAVASVVLSTVTAVEVGRINDIIDEGMYGLARRRELPWVVVGFVFCWVITGALLLTAYRYLEEAEAWRPPEPQGQEGGSQEGGGYTVFIGGPANST